MYIYISSSRLTIYRGISSCYSFHFEAQTLRENIVLFFFFFFFFNETWRKKKINEKKKKKEKGQEVEREIP